MCAVSIHGAIEIEDLKNGSTLKVNGQWLKPFLELEIPEIEELPLEDLTSSNWSSAVESLSEDCKLSTYGRHPLSFYFLLVVFVLIVIVIFFLINFFFFQDGCFHK